MEKIYRLNPWFFAGLLAYLLLGLPLLLMAPKESLVLWLNAWHHPLPDMLAKYLTHAGDGVFCVLVCLLLLLVRYYYAVLMFAGFLLSSLLTQLLKHTLFSGTPRPLAYIDKTVPLHLVEGVKVHQMNSFPSGHATTVFMMCCMLGFFLANKRWGLPLLLFAVLVSLTRPYLVQHFFVDTYFGALIGTGSAVLVYQLAENNQSLRRLNWLQKSLKITRKN